MTSLFSTLHRGPRRYAASRSLRYISRLLPIGLGLLALQTFYGCPTPTHPSLGDTLALWTFEGNLADVSGNGHDGTPVGHVHYATDRTKTVGRALVLDSNASVLVSNVGNLAFTGQSSYTITSWIRTASMADQAIYNWGPAKAKSPGLVLGLSHGRAYAAITASPSPVEVTGASVVADGHWHLLTLTVDAPNKVKLYVDTSLVAQSGTGSLKPDDQNQGIIRIGRYADSSKSFYGSIAKIAIYKYVFPQPRLLEEYMDDVAGGPPITGLTAPTDNLTLACDNLGRIAVSNGNTNFAFSPPQGVGTVPLYCISAADSNYAVAGGDNGTLIATSNGGQTWAQVNVPTDIAGQTIFAVRLVRDTILIGGGSEDENAPTNFLMIGTPSGPWPHHDWAQVATLPARAISSIAINGKSGIAVGWDSKIYACNDLGTPQPHWAPVNADPNLHFTSVDLHTSSGDGSLVTDDGFHYPVAGLSVGQTDWNMAGNALWTTLSTPTDLWIGGAMGDAATQSAQGPGDHLAILKHNNVNAATDAPRQIWHAGARSPSNRARVGGLEDYMHNGAPGTVVFIQ